MGRCGSFCPQQKNPAITKYSGQHFCQKHNQSRLRPIHQFTPHVRVPHFGTSETCGVVWQKNGCPRTVDYRWIPQWSQAKPKLLDSWEAKCLWQLRRCLSQTTHIFDGTKRAIHGLDNHRSRAGSDLALEPADLLLQLPNLDLVRGTLLHRTLSLPPRQGQT